MRAVLGRLPRLFLGDLGADLVHVELADLADQVVQGVGGQCADLQEDQDLLEEHRQRRDRANAEQAGQLLLRLGVDLGEDHVGLNNALLTAAGVTLGGHTMRSCRGYIQRDPCSFSSPFVTAALITPTARANAALVGYTPSSSIRCHPAQRTRVTFLICSLVRR